MDVGHHDGHQDNDEDQTRTTNSTMRTGSGTTRTMRPMMNVTTRTWGQGWECQWCDDKDMHADNDEDADADTNDDANRDVDDECHDDKDSGWEHENEDGGHNECHDGDRDADEDQTQTPTTMKTGMRMMTDANRDDECR
jgi:hypothetical protein